MKYEDFDYSEALKEYDADMPMDFTPTSPQVYLYIISRLNEIRSEIKAIPDSGYGMVSSLCCILGAFIGKCSEDEPSVLYDKICRRIRFYETLNREG